MPSHVRLVNLKAGRPSVEQARARLNAEIHRAKADRIVVLKLIHGYGSSGVGGAIKTAVRRSLHRRQREGKIQSFVAGESWELFNEAAQGLLQACPALASDCDLNNYNEGVTFVLL